jgi:hypothetical protein
LLTTQKQFTSLYAKWVIHALTSNEAWEIIGSGLAFKTYWPPLNLFKSRGIFFLRAFGKPRKSLSLGITREEMDIEMASL